MQKPREFALKRPWSELSRLEQLGAWDQLDRIIAETCRELERDIDAMLAAEGVPLRLDLRHAFTPTDNRLDPRL